MGVKQAITGTSTAAQRRAIVLAGRRLGLSLDALRGLTPQGSLRALSFAQAAALLDQLNQGRQRPAYAAKRLPASDARASGDAGSAGRRSVPGIVKFVTPAQREEMEALRLRLGWSPKGLDRFLDVTFGLTTATRARRRDASRAIAILNKILDHAVSKERRRLEAEVG